MEGEKKGKKRNKPKPQQDEVPKPLPNSPAGNAEYDAMLGDDESHKRPPIPGDLLDQWKVSKVDVDPDDVD